ncbi:hypothetical protein OPV22_022379 [Ensete ventricosum]|uniref:Uncharacterized protein n=1 Tax=Ensete ventricosum TaxID=4639 RepID=A0AAV8QQN1_ENSVE|nr:hypothetical protein OPV22_022379 [Ensete ventricosum]
MFRAIHRIPRRSNGSQQPRYDHIAELRISIPDLGGSRGKGPREWGGSSFLCCRPSPDRFCLLILTGFASRGHLQSSLIEE